MTGAWPSIRPVGLDGCLVSFADRLSDPDNRAALAFRAEIDAAGLDWVEETSTSLVSVYLRFDPLDIGIDDAKAALRSLLAGRDWRNAPLPDGRRLWTIPAAFGGAAGPQLDEVAAATNRSIDDAIAEICEAPLRVLTIGFAPGQPYLGQLPERWDIPRQTELTPRVPPGAIVVAVRQLVLFSVPSPTGWRQIGRSAFRPFAPEAEGPFPLSAGDEIRFVPMDEAAIAALEASDPNGGATWEPLP